jgi:hypothetical protein
MYERGQSTYSCIWHILGLISWLELSYSLLEIALLEEKPLKEISGYRNE